MARDSQPPPPQVIADLQERLDALQAEFDDYRAAADAHTQSAIDAVASPLQDQLQSMSNELGKSHSENMSLMAIVKERDDEIVYLQGQLEEAVNELAKAKFESSTTNSLIHSVNNATSGVSSPLRLMRDVKQRLHILEDRLSRCNISQSV